MPNPSSSLIKAVMPEAEEIRHMMLFDMQGRLVKEIGGAQARIGEMPVSEFPAGMYILKTIGSRGTIAQEQMVIQR